MHKICCNTTQNTRNQRVAEFTQAKYSTDSTKGYM